MVDVVPFLLATALATSGASAQPALSLEGGWLVASGDDPSWADPSLETGPTWRHVVLPSRHSQSRYPAVIWYRKAFKLPETLAAHDLGLLLGLVENCDQVYLNGGWIGGEGSFTDAYILPFRSGRLYRLPDRLLRRNGADNVLAVRLKLYAPVGGISRGPLRIGPYDTLRLEFQEQVHHAKQNEAVLLTFMGMLLVGALWLCVAGRFTGECISFTAFVFLLGLNVLLESSFFYDAGLMSRWTGSLLIAVYYLEPIPAVCFVSYFYKNRLTAAAIALCLGFALLDLPFLLSGSLEHQVLIDSAFLLLFLASILFGLHHSARAFSRERTIENLGVLSGLVLLAVGVAWDVFGYLGLNPAAGQESMLSYAGLGGLTFCMASALSYRYARMRGELEALSLRVLSRRDEERNRIATDLHDGLAQALLAIMMDVELVHRGQVPGTSGVAAACRSVSQKLGKGVDELYHIIHDLRPVSLEQIGFRNAVVAAVQEIARPGQVVDVRVDEGLPLEDPTETQLYRIVQEAVRNAVQHADASRIEVGVGRSGRYLRMTVRDDGRGFGGAHPGRPTGGVGLLAMKERARRLGGTFEVSSSPGRGTTVVVEVPAP